MEQIYKNLYKDENGKYVFANEDDTRYVVDQQSYILIYILEVLLDLDAKEGDREIFLNSEKGEKINGET